MTAAMIGRSVVGSSWTRAGTGADLPGTGPLTVVVIPQPLGFRSGAAPPPYGERRAPTATQPGYATEEAGSAVRDTSSLLGGERPPRSERRPAGRVPSSRCQGFRAAASGLRNRAGRSMW